MVINKYVCQGHDIRVSRYQGITISRNLSLLVDFLVHSCKGPPSAVFNRFIAPGDLEQVTITNKFNCTYFRGFWINWTLLIGKSCSNSSMGITHPTARRLQAGTRARRMLGGRWRWTPCPGRQCPFCRSPSPGWWSTGVVASWWNNTTHLYYHIPCQCLKYFKLSSIEDNHF